MTFQTTRRTPHDEIDSLLRTGPESTQPSRVGSDAREEGGPGGARSIFPIATPPTEILSELSAWDHFAVVAIHIDRPAEGDDHQILHTAIQDALNAMDKIQTIRWFRWDRHLYGCAVHEADAQTAQRLGRRIQAALAESLLDTVSIGISEFPLADYNCRDTFQNACKAIDHAAFFGPGSLVIFDAVSLNIRADYCYQADQMDAAMIEYRAALSLDPGDVNVHNSLGVCLAQTGDMEAAGACFEKALALDPEEAMAAYNLGVLCLLQKDDGAALEHFLKAWERDDRTFEIPFQIGKLLTEKGAFEEARPYLETALQRDRTAAPVYNCLGRCQHGLGHTQEAIAAFKRAVKINPNDAAALSALATLYDLKGENPEICLTFGRQSVALAPDNGEFRMRLAELYQRHNQLDQALSEYQSAAALGADSSEQIARLRAQLQAPAAKKQCCA